MFTKAECRLRFKTMRDGLSKDQYVRFNRSLLDEAKKIPLVGVNCIHLFLPIVEQKEPNTFLIIEYLTATYPAIKIVVPRSDVQSNLLTHHVFGHHQELVRNKWGILEPHEATEPVEEHMIDLIFLPLLAFDQQGNRVGYGKGYYDRFLNACKPDVQKIGLSLFGPVDQIADVEPHDVPLDKCITPEKTWVF
ncbi:5-formyltetrahydrofolate cyclo-ligase [Olivibacter ginsenosidimutans]